MFEIKKDKYQKLRGGNSRIIEILCKKCSGILLVYQKDGLGQLKRCYLNRIFAPSNFARLQYENWIKIPDDVPKLSCSNCNEVIASPIIHHDGRLALRLRPGFFYKRRWKERIEK